MKKMGIKTKMKTVLIKSHSEKSAQIDRDNTPYK